MEKEEIY